MIGSRLCIFLPLSLSFLFSLSLSVCLCLCLCRSLCLSVSLSVCLFPITTCTPVAMSRSSRCGAVRGTWTAVFLRDRVTWEQMGGVRRSDERGYKVYFLRALHSAEGRPSGNQTYNPHVQVWDEREAPASLLWLWCRYCTHHVCLSRFSDQNRQLNSVGQDHRPCRPLPCDDRGITLQAFSRPRPPTEP